MRNTEMQNPKGGGGFGDYSVETKTQEQGVRFYDCQVEAVYEGEHQS